MYTRLFPAIFNQCNHRFVDVNFSLGMIWTSLNQTSRKIFFKFRCNDKKSNCIRIKVDSNKWNFPLSLALTLTHSHVVEKNIFCFWSLLRIHWRVIQLNHIIKIYIAYLILVQIFLHFYKTVWCGENIALFYHLWTEKV